MQPAILSDQPFIICGHDLPASLGHFLKSYKGHRLLVLADSNTTKLVPQYQAVFEQFDENFLRYVIPAGEEHKNLHSAMQVWDTLIKNGCGRNTILLGLGGGMICDLTGFAASVFMRGIPFVFLPGSVLAMADASAGGKTGINLEGLKNIIGTFTEAAAVFIDFNFLSTLPSEERKSGIAEILKHAALLGKPLRQLTKTCMTDSLEDHIIETVNHKLSIVNQDFREQNVREALNLGHTVAHALETLYLNQGKSLLHGYAVAAGLCIESFLAESYFNEGFDLQYHEGLREEVFSEYPRVHFNEIDFELLLPFMRNDKKNRKSTPSFSLLKGPANWQLQCRPNEKLIRNALLNYLRHA
jgi:3-dehydroquinate synthase